MTFAFVLHQQPKTPVHWTEREIHQFNSGSGEIKYVIAYLWTSPKAWLVMQLNNNEKRVKCSIIRSLMLFCVVCTHVTRSVMAVIIKQVIEIRQKAILMIAIWHKRSQEHVYEHIYNTLLGWTRTR